MYSDEYNKQVGLLTEWFKGRIPQIGIPTVSASQWNRGIDSLDDKYRKLCQEAFDEWWNVHFYELSYSQMCDAFFASVEALKEQPKQSATFQNSDPVADLSRLADINPDADLFLRKQVGRTMNKLEDQNG